MPRVALAGDVMLGRHVGERLREAGAEHVWGGTLPALLAADLRFVNLECVVSNRGAPVDKTFNFRAPPEAIAALRAAAIDAVTLANNHVFDYGPEAFVDMLERLDAAGIARAGAGRDADEAWTPAFVESRGMRVGLLAFTDNEPGWAAGPSRPGVAWCPIEPGSRAHGSLLARVARAHRACDALVVAAHWGPNMRTRPTRAFETFARSVVDAGAAVFWGTSAHVIQGVERRRRSLILYDTGDFVDDYRVDPRLRNDRSFLYEVDLGHGEARALRLTPVLIDPRRAAVDLAPGEDAEATRRALDRRSRAYGSRFDEEGGRLVMRAAH
ncbi:MAG TPA: CapA family protein [Candidatus Thermoplasmatota archaeon]|nr:CapA family protein [Candidatus Thermoplasmatota archaeon]